MPLRPEHLPPASSSELRLSPLLEEFAVLKRSFVSGGQEIKQSQYCSICSIELGPDDPMPCFPDSDNSRECIRCLMEYEQEMFEEHAQASSDG